MGEFVVRASLIGDALRNRSWMHNVQDPFFTGEPLDELLLSWFPKALGRVFVSVHEFVSYYIAKDSVLQYRLQTLY